MIHQYAAEHLSVIASGASLAWLLPRQQRSNALPLGVGENTSFLVSVNGRRRGATFVGIGWIGAASSTSIMVGGMMLGGVLLVPMASLVATFGHGLVGSTKQRPSQPKLPVIFGTHHRTDQSPFLHSAKFAITEFSEVRGINLRPLLPALPSYTSASEK